MTVKFAEEDSMLNFIKNTKIFANTLLSIGNFFIIELKLIKYLKKYNLRGGKKWNQ